MTIPAPVKRSIGYVIGGFVVLLLGVAIIRAYDLGGEYRHLWSEYRTAQKAQEKQAASFSAEIAGLCSKIGDLTGKIDQVTATSGQPTPAEKAKDQAIAVLSKRISELEAAGDCPGALLAAKDEIQAWSEKFNLADARHRESIAALNGLWTAKYDAQVIISTRWEKLYTDEYALRLRGEDVTRTLRTELRKCRFVSTIKTGAVVAIAGYLAYKTIIPKQK